MSEQKSQVCSFEGNDNAGAEGCQIAIAGQMLTRSYSISQSKAAVITDAGVAPGS